MRKKCQLTVEPLSFHTIENFTQNDLHLPNDMDDVLKAFENGMPPHQAAFFDGNECVLLTGLIKVSDNEYWSWTLYGKGFKAQHLKQVKLYLAEYRYLLEFPQICHIISKQRPWTRKIAKVLGFSYIRDLNDEYEWWVI